MPQPEAGRSPSRPGLPAPYTNPWQLLGRDLAAVMAATGLKLRELWRLNGEGELPRPRFWPGPLAAAFWPLLLALVLVLGFGGVLPRLLANHAPANPDPGQVAGAGAEGLTAAGKTQRTAVGKQQPDGGESPDGVENPDRGQRPTAAPATPLAPQQAGSSAAESAAEPGLEAAAEPDLESGLESAPESGLESAAAVEAAAAQRLLADLVGPQPPNWVLALEERPAQGLLRLRLGAAFSALPQGERRNLAEGWLERGRALGYENLELLDASSRLLARQARVGSGMILLESGQPSDDPARGATDGALG